MSKTNCLFGFSLSGNNNLSLFCQIASKNDNSFLFWRCYCIKNAEIFGNMKINP